MFCPNCHKAIPLQSVFCGHCGTQISQPPTPPAEPQDAPIQLVEPVLEPQDAPVQLVKPQNQPPAQSWQALPIPPAPVVAPPKPAPAPRPPQKPSQFWRGIRVFGGALAAMALLTLFSILLQPALFQFASPAMRFTPAFSGTAPDWEETQRLKTLSAYFIHPAAQAPRPAQTALSSIPTPTPEPGQESPAAPPYRMALEGTLTRLAQVNSLQYEDWQTAYLLGIQNHEREWLVLYRGSVLSLQVGNRLQIEGLYVPQADGLHADLVRNLDAQAAPPDNLLWFERAAWLTGMFILLTAAWVIWARGKRPPKPARKSKLPAAALGALLLLAVSFSACTLDITVLLQADGSATMLVRMGDTRETLDFLRQVPGMAGYMQSALEDMRASGALVDQAIVGDQEIFTLQRQVNSGNWTSGAFGPDARSWISLTTYIEGNQKVYRLLGLVDSRVLYEFDQNLDSQIRSGLRDTLNELSLRYTLVMPGAVAYHNASKQQAQTLVWQLRPNDANQIVAEARLPLEQLTPGKDFPPLWMWLALLGIFLLTLLVFLLTLRSLRKAQPANLPAGESS